jgi:predicted RNA binding protein YcfA (HicA-like mRNA interferase family)
MSELDWKRLRGLTAREIVNALLRDGFVHRASATSHQRFHHPDGRRVTVTFHRPGDTFAIGTLRSMIETQARWTEDDLRRLKLIK